MGVQQLEEAWAARAGAREARLLAASHVPAALSQLGIVCPGDCLVAFADDFTNAFAHGFDGCDVALVGSPSAEAFAAASEGFDASFDAEGPIMLLGFYDYTVVLTYISLGISVFGITR